MTQAVIMAAGKSTRTYPLTLTRPKPLLKIANKTLLEHNLDALAPLVDEVIIIVHYRKDMIIKRFGTNYKGLKLTYVDQAEAKGTGHYVGCNMNMQGRRPFSFWFLEGDEMIYVDDEQHPPAIHGTGTEDYFNAGWYFNKGTFSAPYHGLTIKDPIRSRISAYRFHIEDPIPFKKRIRVTIEHGGINDAPGSDYSSTAYWYQTEPHKPMGTFPPGDDRLPDDGLLVKSAKNTASDILKIGFDIAEQLKKISPKR